MSDKPKQHWHPTAADLDALARHCREQYEKRKESGSLGTFTEIKNHANSSHPPSCRTAAR